MLIDSQKLPSIVTAFCSPLALKRRFVKQKCPILSLLLLTHF